MTDVLVCCLEKTVGMVCRCMLGVQGGVAVEIEGNGHRGGVKVAGGGFVLFGR